jgi:hypothetical protein
MPLMGFLGSGSASGFADSVAGFRQGLSEAGYVEGRNLANYRAFEQEKAWVFAAVWLDQWGPGLSCAAAFIDRHDCR